MLRCCCIHSRSRCWSRAESFLSRAGYDSSLFVSVFEESTLMVSPLFAGLLYLPPLSSVDHTCWHSQQTKKSAYTTQSISSVRKQGGEVRGVPFPSQRYVVGFERRRHPACRTWCTLLRRVGAKHTRKRIRQRKFLPHQATPELCSACAVCPSLAFSLTIQHPTWSALSSPPPRRLALSSSSPPLGLQPPASRQHRLGLRR